MLRLYLSSCEVRGFSLTSLLIPAIYLCIILFQMLTLVEQVREGSAQQAGHLCGLHGCVMN